MASGFIAIVSIVLLLFFLILLMAVLVFSYWGLWKMFDKAGQSGWKSLIPYYNNYVLMVDIGGLHIGYFIASISLTVLSIIISLIFSILSIYLKINAISYLGNLITWFISIVSILINIATMYNLSKKFNKGIGWVILSIFFSFITLPLLGFLKTEEYKNVKVCKHSLFASLIEKK